MTPFTWVVSTTIPVAVTPLPHFTGLTLPQYQTSGSVGFDLQAALTEPILIRPGTVSLIPTGLTVAIPEGYEIQIRSRSGLALNSQVVVLNAPGTIDSDYRGEIGVILMNHGKNPFKVDRGMRIAQAVLAKVEHLTWRTVEKLDETDRGAAGFGSTNL